MDRNQRRVVEDRTVRGESRTLEVEKARANKVLLPNGKYVGVTEARKFNRYQEARIKKASGLRSVCRTDLWAVFEVQWRWYHVTHVEITEVEEQILSLESRDGGSK